MSETKHTPGPWKVYAECDQIVVAEDSVYGVQVADCGKPNGDEYQPREGEAEANARLIASAPELLEALKYALAFLDRPDITTYEWYKLAPEHVGKFRSAIAKAEGR